MAKEPFNDYESYLNSLSLPREPDTEDLTPDEMARITQAVFAEPQYAPADLLFVFGTSAVDQQLLDRLAQACCQGDFPHLLVTGGPVGRAYSGRCVRTLRKFYPALPLYPIMFAAEYEGTTVARQDWWQKSVARARVYGEFLRIKKYGDRGDIAPL